LESTTTLKVATGIVHIWTAAAQPVAGGPDKVLPTLSELAGPLGLSR